MRYNCAKHAATNVASKALADDSGPATHTATLTITDTNIAFIDLVLIQLLYTSVDAATISLYSDWSFNPGDPNETAASALYDAFVSMYATYSLNGTVTLDGASVVLTGEAGWELSLPAYASGGGWDMPGYVDVGGIPTKVF